MSPTKPGNRLVFANQLRGMAAVLVAVSHLVGVYWAIPAFVAAATFSPVQPGPVPSIYGWISFKWFELGPFGVALFFLISGLVIPFSLEKHTGWTFFISRVLRIYPTFILVLLMETFLLYLASEYWRIPFAYNAGEIISNCLLLNSIIGYPDIDFVNWTLSIEIKFYLLIMLAAPLIRNGKVYILFVIAILISIINFSLSRRIGRFDGFDAFTFPHGVRLESPYLIFMLIGVLFYFHDRKYFGYKILSSSVIGLTVLFICTWRLSLLRLEYPIVTANYLEAILVFGGLYLIRDRVRNIRIIDFMAAISFPFYLIHAVLGFTIMKFLIVKLYFNYYVALACALAVITGVAFLLHLTIETATINAGRALARSPKRLPI